MSRRITGFGRADLPGSKPTNTNPNNATALAQLIRRFSGSPPAILNRNVKRGPGASRNATRGRSSRYSGLHEEAESDAYVEGSPSNDGGSEGDGGEHDGWDSVAASDDDVLASFSPSAGKAARGREAEPAATAERRTPLVWHAVPVLVAAWLKRQNRTPLLVDYDPEVAPTRVDEHQPLRYTAYGPSAGPASEKQAASQWVRAEGVRPFASKPTPDIVTVSTPSRYRVFSPAAAMAAPPRARRFVRNTSLAPFKAGAPIEVPTRTVRRTDILRFVPLPATLSDRPVAGVPGLGLMLDASRSEPFRIYPAEEHEVRHRADGKTARRFEKPSPEMLALAVPKGPKMLMPFVGAT